MWCPITSHSVIRTILNGQVVQWSGRGRTPKAIAEALASGRSLEVFLIEK
ncbi:TPA: H-NS histone family protein [Salmonella enterica]|nr:H-NS histone family protein [Salmonella enterica]